MGQFPERRHYSDCRRKSLYVFGGGEECIVIKTMITGLGQFIIVPGELALCAPTLFFLFTYTATTDDAVLAARSTG